MGNKYCDKELLEKLKEWAKKHKKSPAANDLNNDNSIPNASTYTRRFGSFNKAKELASLEIIRTLKRYTDEELLEKLKEWSKIHGKSPTIDDIQKDRSMPQIITYVNRFGSFNKAKELAGLEINQSEYTKEELIAKLKEWTKTHKKSPSAHYIDRDKSMPAAWTYITHFGSFNNAKEIAGLEIFAPDSQLNHVTGLLDEWKNGRNGEISPITLNGYLRELIYLEKYLIEKGKTIAEMAVIDIKNFILEIKDSYAKKSMELKFNAIRNFLKFFLRKAIVEKSEPLFDLSMIELINAFFKTQLRQMEDYSEDDPALSEDEVKIIKEKLTDYPLLQTMFILDLNLGLRASEFVKIKIKQGLISNRKQAQKGDVWIDLSRGILMVYRGKSRSPHLVALTREMVQLVKKQLTLHKLYGVKHEYLFFSKKGKPLRDHSIYPYYLQISKIVGFRVTSHKVRRTMATMLEKRGVPHSIIQRRMGHKPKDDTQHYQRFPIQERIQILEEKVGIL